MLGPLLSSVTGSLSRAGSDVGVVCSSPLCFAQVLSRGDYDCGKRRDTLLGTRARKNPGSGGGDGDGGVDDERARYIRFVWNEPWRSRKLAREEISSSVFGRKEALSYAENVGFFFFPLIPLHI